MNTTKAVLSLALAAVSFVSSGVAYGAWGNDVKLMNLDVSASGTYVTGNVNMGCGGATRSWLSSGTPGYKDLLSTLMVAYVANKTVTVFFTNCNGDDSPFDRVLVKN